MPERNPMARFMKRMLRNSEDAPLHAEVFNHILNHHSRRRFDLGTLEFVFSNEMKGVKGRVVEGEMGSELSGDEIQRNHALYRLVQPLVESGVIEIERPQGRISRQLARIAGPYAPPLDRIRLWEHSARLLVDPKKIKGAVWREG